MEGSLIINKSMNQPMEGSDLCGYLNTLDFDGDLTTLKEHFLTKFGVKIKNEGHNYLFKYDMIKANWKEDITLQCRGHILEFNNGEWVWRSRPFDKFFNQHETKCPIYSEDLFNFHLQDFCLMEKADGTCIQVWFDGEKWRISTLGSITPTLVGSCGITFTELFENILNRGLLDLEHYLSQDNTYIFELCSAENRVVTEYREGVIFILGARSTFDGHHLEDHIIEEFAENLLQNGFNIKLPSRVKVKSCNFATLSDVQNFVEEESKNYEKYGNFPEGFIINWNGMPIAKLKNHHYVQLHRNQSSPIQFQEFIIDAIFEGTLDDISGTIPRSMTGFCTFARNEVQQFLTQLIALVSKIREEIYVNQKEYAQKVLCETSDKRFQNFLFRQKHEILGEEYYEAIEGWFLQNRSRFFDDIKNRWKEQTTCGS